MIHHDNYKQFAIVRDVEPLAVVLHLFGDVDLSTVGELKEAIDKIALDGDALLINLSKCRYFDSSGLAALYRAQRLLGARLEILVDPRSQVYRVMRIVGFDKLFRVVTELRPACRAEFDAPDHTPSSLGHSVVRAFDARPAPTIAFAHNGQPAP